MWKIVDRRTDAEMGMSVYTTRQQAEQQITVWQNRHDRGGRPDITRDMLLNMVPREIIRDSAGNEIRVVQIAENEDAE